MLTITDDMRNDKVYDGTSPKFGVTINGQNYIVKLRKDAMDMTVICEYVASQLITALGVSCHEVTLGHYNGELVAVLKDFTSDGKKLHSFSDTNQSSVDTDLKAKEYTYSDVLDLIDKNLKMTSAMRVLALRQFWDMFICDAILANRDRHGDNWGYLITNNGYVPAPLFDNGSSLFPGVFGVISGYVSEQTRKDFLYQRVRQFPASVFKVRRQDRAYRTNFYEMFSDLRVNRIFAERVRLIKSRLSVSALFSLMCNIVKDLPIDYKFKRFYVEIVVLRYSCIVLRMNFDKVYKLVEDWLVQ